MFRDAMKNFEPVFYSEADNCFVLSRHEHVKNMIGDYEIYDSRQGSLQNTQVKEDSYDFDPIFLQSPPNHTRMRKLAAGAFSISAVTHLSEAVNEIAIKLARDIESGDSHFDVVAQYAEPMVIESLLKMLAVPDNRLSTLSDVLKRMFRRNDPDPQAAKRVADEFAAYVVEHYEYVRTKKIGGFPGAIVNGEVNGDRFTRGEAFGMLIFSIVGGAEDMIRSLANVVYVLWRFPAAKQELMTDIERHMNAVFLETARLLPTTQYLKRVTKRAITLNGVEIPEGSNTVGLIGAANRDADVFECGDVFDLGRRNVSAALTFGTGPHVCIGKHVAKMIVVTGAKALLRQCPDLQVDISNSPVVLNAPIMGFKRLSVRSQSVRA